MKEAIRKRLSGLYETIVRYPLTTLLLLAAAVLTAVSIAGDDGLLRSILTLCIGAVSAAAAQSAFERFYAGLRWRIILYIASLVVTALFYVSIRSVSENGPELAIRTAVTGFALWIAYIWLAVVRSDYTFAGSFMASFKALFQALFFTGIIFLGCVLIIAAIDSLITPIDEDAYMHAANVIFMLIAPLLYFSLIPIFPGRRSGLPEGEAGANAQARIDRRTGCPKFLEVLLSYIVIPLAAVFTVVLLIYIVLNIGGSFWTDNLLEPMLISYSVVVIAVTLLIVGLENKFAALFRLIFPKVLIPIALFQTIASFRLMADTGLTHGRYYVVLFGLFAVVSGVVLSALPKRRNGTVAAVLILLSVLSLVPPVDAFTLSRFSQIRTMESVLAENGMLSGGQVVPSGGISEDGKTKIIAAVRYLTDMEALDRIKWLPAGFNGYDDTQFYDVFGFHMYAVTSPGNQYVYVFYNIAQPISIEGYDVMCQMMIPYPGTPHGNEATMELGGAVFRLSVDGSGAAAAVVLRDGDGQELCRFASSGIFDRYAGYTSEKNELTAEEAAFTAQTDQAELKIVVQNASLTKAADGTSADESAEILVFVRIK